MPMGHGVGLCDAEAEGTGRSQVWRVGSLWVSGSDPASDMDRAIMALSIGPTSAQPPWGPTPLKHATCGETPDQPSPVAGGASSGLIKPRANECLV